MSPKVENRRPCPTAQREPGVALETVLCLLHTLWHVHTSMLTCTQTHTITTGGKTNEGMRNTADVNPWLPAVHAHMGAHVHMERERENTVHDSVQEQSRAKEG